MGFSRTESVSPLVVDINGKFQEGKVKKWRISWRVMTKSTGIHVGVNSKKKRKKDILNKGARGGTLFGKAQF